MRTNLMRLLSSLLLCTLLAACGDNAEEATEAGSSLLAVTLVPTQVRTLPHSVRVSGPVSPYEDMQLGVELSGLRVTALNVDVGQWVRKDQVLLTLDHRTLDSDLAQADASLRQAQASLELAQVNHDRGAKLVDRQLISASQLDELRAARIQAEAQVATARAGRDAVRLRRDFAELRAPADGIISKRLVQPGQVVAAGSELLRMIRDGRLEWRAELAETQLAEVEVGDVVELPYGGQVVSGIIRAVSPGVDAQTRTGTVYADLPDPGPLKTGIYVEGRIVTGEGQALTVPVASVVQRDGHSYVFTLGDADTVQRRRVRTGLTDDGRIEIVDGLADGERVVEQGAGFLGDGDRVRVVTEADTGANAETAEAAP